jgi:hypothetical protein
LFRHFATREALMVAVGEDVGTQLLERYKRKFKALKKHASIHGAARELLPDVAAALGDTFEVFVSTIVAVFDGEQVRRFVVRDPRALDEARIDLLAAAFRGHDVI